MSGYTKLFGSILRSTVWKTPPHVRLVWITMLALADRDGIVDSSVPGLADAAGVERTQCDQALALFLAPDPDSRTPDNEGRRIEKVDGGWRVLNHGKYADKLSVEDRRSRDAERQKRCRERRVSRDASRDVTLCHAESHAVTPVTPSHASHDMQMQMQMQTQIERSDARDPEPMAPTATTARAESRTAGYEQVRLALVAAYKAAGAMVPTRDLSVPHSSLLMSLADAFDGDATAMAETIAGFFADQRAAKEGWPLSWLAKNPNAYRRRSGGGPGSPPTALPADLWDHERLVLSRALRGDWWKPGTKADRWYRALLARHPGIGPTPPEQAVAE